MPPPATHGLVLPTRASPSALPPLPSSSSSSSQPPPPATTRQPPRNYAQHRAEARSLRADRVTSPFVKRPNAGKERDLSLLSVDQLADMLDRTARLLDSPDTTAALPGGDARLRTQQQRIAARLAELRNVQSLRADLAATHLQAEDDMDGVVAVKSEEEEEGASPSAKRRIAAAFLARPRPSHALTAPLSLADSLALQSRAAAADRARAERRRIKSEALAAAAVGKANSGRRAVKGEGDALGGFSWSAAGVGGGGDSDDSLSETEADDWLSSVVASRAGANGALDDDEDAQLNPLRTAYMEGWNRAEKEG
ncbi:hypothetical protein JCM10449v2_000870 [Rhodotorula kratochvilovae]